MKTSTMIVSMLVISAIALLLITLSVQADQRMESRQGLCHFSYDRNDADNELYFSNCVTTIDTFDARDGNGRLATGMALVTITRSVDVPEFWRPVFPYLYGSDSEPFENDYSLQSNATCTMVTSNYDAANDDDNETVYVSNDWRLRNRWLDWDEDNRTFQREYELTCYDGVKQ